MSLLTALAMENIFPIISCYLNLGVSYTTALPFPATARGLPSSYLTAFSISLRPPHSISFVQPKQTNKSIYIYVLQAAATMLSVEYVSHVGRRKTARPHLDQLSTRLYFSRREKIIKVKASNPLLNTSDVMPTAVTYIHVYYTL